MLDFFLFLAEIFFWLFVWENRDRSEIVLRILVISCVLAGIAGLVYWFCLR